MHINKDYMYEKYTIWNFSFIVSCTRTLFKNKYYISKVFNVFFYFKYNPLIPMNAVFRIFDQFKLI